MRYRQEEENLYQILEVRTNCTFDELRTAYRRLAKVCHPDLFNNDASKTAQFQRLVHAFDILSDAESRREYDRRLAFSSMPPQVENLRTTSVMDTVADDILEELVVGEEMYRITSLQTLMLDLARTERFILFRQAKDFYERRQYGKCSRICSKLIDASPDNILYHFYYGEASRQLHRFSRAAKQYRICLDLGARRNPPQILRVIRKRYNNVLQKRGWFSKLLGRMFGVTEPPPPSDEDQLRRALEAAFRQDAPRGNQQKRQLHARQRKMIR